MEFFFKDEKFIENKNFLKNGLFLMNFKKILNNILDLEMVGWMWLFWVIFMFV